jgi:hypothetical protein
VLGLAVLALAVATGCRTERQAGDAGAVGAGAAAGATGGQSDRIGDRLGERTEGRTGGRAEDRAAEVGSRANELTGARSEQAPKPGGGAEELARDRAAGPAAGRGSGAAEPQAETLAAGQAEVEAGGGAEQGAFARWRADRRARRAVPPPLDPNLPADLDRDLAVADAARFGNGFVVWESVRSGQWRLWIRRLDGSGLRQLSPDEGDRQHCCPHISPDGRSVVYLSVPGAARHQYPPGGLIGPLRLVEVASGEVRELVPLARDYGDHRVAVWRSADELIYLDGRGLPMRLELASGHREAVLARSEAQPDHGYLVDATLSWATSAVPSFAPVDPVRRTLGEVERLRGCEPYFSHDGSFAFFVERGGGPIRSFDLATRRLGTILERGDPRLPPGFDYVYFPMVSRAGDLIVFAASQGVHDQFRADYELFVARFDPSKRELVDRPVRVTAHPATDRFPDVWSTGALGARAGRPAR